MKRKASPKMRNLTRQQRKLWETFVFLAKVIALSLPLYFIILFSIPLTQLQIFDAYVSSGMLTAMGYHVEQAGASITVGYLNPFSYYLSEDCTAWKSVLFLFALIFAVPAVSMRSRLVGLGLGIPVLWLGNQARIVGVVVTERATDVTFAMLTHDYLWRAFLVALVLGLWMLWARNPQVYERLIWKAPQRTSSRIYVGKSAGKKRPAPGLYRRKGRNKG